MMNNINQHISLTRSTINCGKGDGCKIITIDNGILSIVLDESHGLDIYSLRYEGKLISLLTSNGMVKDSPFLTQFPGGMLYTCGLDAIGSVEGHRQHGNFHMTPAEIVRIDHQENELTIVANINITGLFSPIVTVERTINIKYLANDFSLVDLVINKSDADQDIVMLYHFNMGYPFIDGDTQLQIGSTKIKGVNSFAEARKDKCLFLTNEYEEEEEVFYHYDANDVIKVTSNSQNLVFSLKYDKNIFPILTEWKCLVKNNVALGIEPSMSEMGKNLRYRSLKKNEVLMNRFELKIDKK
ncbi:MAG TPA: DUF4432 family protein [Erysipelotrichaceae bacterium]|nr:DUF4432 family protein [Erysipelotrichaceae bacterium]